MSASSSSKVDLWETRGAADVCWRPSGVKAVGKRWHVRAMGVNGPAQTMSYTPTRGDHDEHFHDA
jgi:hypothetical protein